MSELDDADALTRQINLDTVFRPSAPINTNELFFGRQPQQWALGEAVRSPGQHAVIYGSRGVGKTSLASVFGRRTASEGHIAVIITCDLSDNFASLWQKFIDECGIWLAENPDKEPIRPAIERAAEILNSDEVGPGQVRVAMRTITATPGVGQVVVFFDEFDQLVDHGTIELLANTIKALSDKAEPVTIIPVGVAHSVDDLIAAHQSVRRSLAQVQMPRMSRQELRDIVLKGLAELEMTASEQALLFVETVPRGLPHYAHLLAQEGARQALMRRSTNIVMDDMVKGLGVGLDKVDHTLTSAYDEATYSPQPTARHREVLLACALTEPDEHGYFVPADLREPYSALCGEPKDIQHFNPQLAELCEGRGEALTRTGPRYRRRYRFSDPLMEPFVMLKGIEEKLVTPDALLGRKLSPPPASPTEPPQLFD